MGTLTSCLKKSGKNISQSDRAEILSAAQVNRQAGMKAEQSAIKAVDDQMAKVLALIEVMKAPAKPANAAPQDDAEGLTAPSQQDVLNQQDRKENADKLDDKAQIDREATGQTLTSQSAPEQRTDNSGDMFAMEKAVAEIDKRNAGQAAKTDPNQGGMFDDPVAETRATLDANNVTGKERLDVLKDVKSGALTVDEVKDAYPVKDTAKSESAAPEAKTSIGDFGQKIGGAKKDLWETYEKKLGAVQDADLATQPLSKSWPEPDYQEMLDGGADPWTVGFVRAARDAIPRKPTDARKAKAWAGQVQILRGFAVKLLNGEITQNMIRVQIDKLGAISRSFAGMFDRIQLYMLVGHSQSLDGVTISMGQYGMHNGIAHSPAKIIWTVSKEAKATAFSNWPRELGVGDTRQAAIADFQAKYADTVIQPVASKEVSFDIWTESGAGSVRGFFVGKKIGRNFAKLTPAFTTLKEAREYKTNNNAELVAKLEKFKEIPSVRRDTNMPRVGADMRAGQDVTPEFFGETFGFKGVEFGNYVEQSKRQKDLNEAFDALMDMAAILGIPPKAISLNGQLGLAFGARGTGGIDPAAAHYERDYVAINLTKKEGAGSLGHEWWHALDNYFSRMRKAGDAMMTEALDVSLSSRNSTYILKGEVRKEMVDAFGSVMRAIKETALKARSSKMDAKRSKEYWTTSVEMSARAFESYLVSKLRDNNASNDYLANIVDEKTWKAMEALEMEMADSFPYPTAGEMPLIRAGFEKFFNTVQTKENDAGDVAMFSKGTGTQQQFQPLANQSTAKALNATLVNYGLGQDWNNAYEAVKLPDALSGVRAAIQTAFGRDVRPIAPTAAKFNIFNGVYIPSQPNAVYVNVAADVGFINIAGHELWHVIKRQRPDLIEWYQGQSRQFYKDLPAYQTRLNALLQPGEKAYDLNKAEEELEADFMGDSLVDPEFLKQLADASPEKFKALLTRVQMWLGSVINKLKGLESSKEVTDVKALQAYLKEVLVAFAEGKDIPAAPRSIVPAFARGTTDAVTKPDVDKYQLAGAVVDGREVRDDVPNMSSIASSLDDYTVLNGVREVPMSDFTLTGKSYSVSESKRIEALAARIKESGEINPLIVVIDREGSYILEGGHRSEALFRLGAKSFPAIVVLDNESLNEPPAPDSGGAPMLSRDSTDQTNTPAFKKWFADSKVVDAKGLPLVVYHGTTADITEFRKTRTGEFGPAIYTTSDPNEAAGYAQGAGSRYLSQSPQNIMPVYVSLQNPFTLGVEVFWKRYNKGDGDTAAVQRAIDDGFDGVIEDRVDYRGKKSFTHFIAFRPEQIKSAIGNSGQFDASNPDIRFSRAEPGSRSGRSMNDSLGALKPESVDVVVNRGNPYTQLLRDGGGGLSLSPEERNFLAAFGNLLVREGVKPTMDESFGNGLMRNAELLSNLANAQPFIDQGYGGLDAPTKRAMLLRMAGLVHNTQILRAVVKFIPIDVMNVLAGQKSAPQGFGRDNSVLADLLPADADMAITRAIDAATSVAKDTETLKAAKESPVLGGSNLGGVTNNGGGANGAGKVGGHSVPGSYWSSPVDYKLDTLIYNIADGRIDLKRVQEAIKAAGAEIAEKFDARQAETLYPGRVARRSETFLNIEVKPLLQDMAINKIDMDTLGDYLIARHAPERNAQIAKVNPDLPDGGAGSNSQGVLMTDDAAAEYLAAIPADKLAKLVNLARKVDAITVGTRALLVGEGLEKQETVDAWTRAYKNYVPLFKDEAEHSHPQGRGFTVKGSSSKRATGSTKEVTNVLAHVLMQREAAVTRAEKNRVGLALYGLALSNPNTDFWTTIKPNMTNEQIMNELQAMGVDPLLAGVGMASAPTVRTVDPLTDKVVDRPNPMYKSLPGAITLRVNGEDRVLMMNQDNERAVRMAENLKNLDGLTAIDWSTGFLHTYVSKSIPKYVAVGPATRWLASVNTQYNPAFGLINVTRDTLGGVINLTNTPLAKQKMKVLAGVPAALKGIARDLRGDTRTEWSDLFNQFQDDGAQTGYKEMFSTADDRAGAIQDEIAAAGKSGLTPGRMAHAVLDLLDDFNTSLENAVRLSAYKAALDEGMSRPASAKLARELTVDFNRKGRLGREVAPLYAFFNAAVQGTARTLETMAGPAGAKIIAGGLALGGLQALMLAFAGFDDDEPPEFIKSRALIIPIVGEKRFIAIPYPLGLHIIPNTGRVLTEMSINGGKNIGKRAVEAIGEIAGAFNPMGGGNIFTTDGALRTLAPTLVDPLIELAANKNFAGTEIEKRPFYAEGDNRPGFQRARESTQRTTTGQAYLGISKAINTMTGGNDFEAGVMSPTPERMRYLAQVVGGGVLREFEKSINTSMGLINDEEVTARGIPVVGRFYGEIDSNQSERSRYFETSKTIKKNETSRKAADKAGATDIADNITKNNPEVEMANYLNKVQGNISKLNKLAAETINDRAELKRIDDDRFELMKDLNDEIKLMERAKREPTIAESLRGNR